MAEAIVIPVDASITLELRVTPGYVELAELYEGSEDSTVRLMRDDVDALLSGDTARIGDVYGSLRGMPSADAAAYVAAMDWTIEHAAVIRPLLGGAR